MRSKTKEWWNTIRRTFTAYDGGVGLIQLKMFLEHIDKQAEKGDEIAIDIIKAVERFNRIIEIATKKSKFEES